jgi:hypothetical protein
MNETTQPGPLEVRLSDQLGLAIMCPAAHGWMPPEDVIEATEGWEIAPDANWSVAMRADLERKLAALPHT